MKAYAAGIRSSELRLVDAGPANSTESNSQETPASPVAGASKGTSAPRNGTANASVAAAPYKLEVVPMVASPPSSTTVAPSIANVGGESAGSDVDKFLTAATKELEAGIVDQPLWKHAIAQSGGDRTAATQSYLRARATALRVTKREKRQERQARRVRALTELASPTENGSAPPQADARSLGTAHFPRIAIRSRATLIGIGCALAVLFVIAVLVVVRSGADAAQHNENTAKSQPAKSQPTAASKMARPTSEVAQANGTRQRDDALRQDWTDKLEKLKSESNWNVVVLYAGEWVRAQPDNATAWKELGGGYVKLRQYRDALEAFQQAVARDDRDAPSFLQIGTLAAQLGRFPDARAAFDKALALNPADVDSLCGAASLAHREQRAKDAEALASQIASLNAQCHDVEGESVRVAVGGRALSPAPAR